MGLREGLVGVNNSPNPRIGIRKSYLNRANLGENKRNSTQRKSAIRDSLNSFLHPDDDDEVGEEFVVSLNNNNNNSGSNDGSNKVGRLRRSFSNEEMSPPGKRGGGRKPIGRTHSGGELQEMQSALFGRRAKQQGESIPKRSNSDTDCKPPVGKADGGGAKSPDKKPVGRTRSGGMLQAMSAALGQKSDQATKPKASSTMDDPFIDYLLGSYNQSPGPVGTPKPSAKSTSSSPGKLKKAIEKKVAKMGISNPLNLSGHLRRNHSDGTLKRNSSHGNRPVSSARKERTLDREGSSSGRKSRTLDRESSCPKSAPLANENAEDGCDEPSTPHHQLRPSLGDCEGGESWLSLETSIPLADAGSADAFTTPTSKTRHSRRSRSPSRSASTRARSLGDADDSSEHFDEGINSSWLGLEASMPLVDNSSEDPAYRTPPARRSNRSPARQSSSSSAVPPPPAYSPVNDCGWLDLDLEMTMPMVDNSSNHSRKSITARRRSRSLGDAEDDDDSPNVKKSPGKSKGRKSRSPGKNKDRKSSSNSSPGKNKDRKSKSSKSPKRDSSTTTKSKKCSSSTTATDDIIKPLDVTCDDFFGGTGSPCKTSKNGSFRRRSFDCLREMSVEDLNLSSHCNMMILDHSAHAGTEAPRSFDNNDDAIAKTRKASPGRTSKKSLGKNKKEKKSKSSKKRDGTKSSSKKDSSSKRQSEAEVKNFDVSCDDFFSHDPLGSIKTSKNGSFRRRSFDCVVDSSLRERHEQIHKQNNIVPSALVRHLVNGSFDYDDHASDIESSDADYYDDDDDDDDEFAEEMASLGGNAQLRGNKKLNATKFADSFRGLSTFDLP